MNKNSENCFHSSWLLHLWVETENHWWSAHDIWSLFWSFLSRHDAYHNNHTLRHESCEWSDALKVASASDSRFTPCFPSSSFPIPFLQDCIHPSPILSAYFGSKSLIKYAITAQMPFIACNLSAATKRSNQRERSTLNAYHGWWAGIYSPCWRPASKYWMYFEWTRRWRMEMWWFTEEIM